MFGEKALELIKELDRSADGLPPFNDDAIRQVIEEMQILYQANQADANRVRMRDSQTAIVSEAILPPILANVQSVEKFTPRSFCAETQNSHQFQLLRRNKNTTSTDMSYYASVQLRHEALSRNKRCILAYLHNRLQKIRQTRWEFGSILPPEIKSLFSEPEVQWFATYSKCLATYMRSIGDSHGLNLTSDITPPKTLYIEVRCVVDYGKFELEDGEVIILKKNSQYLLPRAECEGLVRQGVLQHVIS